MSRPHEALRITAQLYDMRDTYRRLVGDERFYGQVEKFRPELASVKDDHGSNDVQALTLILKAHAGDGQAMLMFSALWVEIVDPTPRQPSGNASEISRAN